MTLIVKIKKDFKNFHLNVDFSNEEGLLGILGASGCGKSITLKCIAGLITPDAGYIELDGRILFDSEKKINLKPQERQVGYLFQNYALFPNMTVRENILIGYNGENAETELAELLERFSILELADRYPRQLSGGQQQRAALARIFANHPRALLLDEPFSALDEHLRSELTLELKEHLDAYEGMILMVTHSRNEVYELSQNLIVMDMGKVLIQEETKTLFYDPQLVKAARLTGCKNISRIEKIAGKRLRALDWGVNLTVDRPIADEIQAIGIRAHDFGGPSAQNRINVFAIEADSTINEPFEMNYVCKTAGPKKIWWMIAKREMPERLPDKLYVDPEKILLLREEENEK